MVFFVCGYVLFVWLFFCFFFFFIYFCDCLTKIHWVLKYAMLSLYNTNKVQLTGLGNSAKSLNIFIFNIVIIHVSVTVELQC